MNIGFSFDEGADFDAEVLRSADARRAALREGFGGDSGEVSVDARLVGSPTFGKIGLSAKSSLGGVLGATFGVRGATTLKGSLLSRFRRPGGRRGSVVYFPAAGESSRYDGGGSLPPLPPDDLEDFEGELSLEVWPTGCTARPWVESPSSTVDLVLPCTRQLRPRLDGAVTLRSPESAAAPKATFFATVLDLCRRG